MVADLSTSYENINALFRFAEAVRHDGELRRIPLDVAMPQLLELVGGTEIYLRIASPRGLFARPRLPGKTGRAVQAARLIPTAAETTESSVFRSGQPTVVEHCARLPRCPPCGGRKAARASAR